VAVDVVAEILSNHPLSRDYNVLGFRAPDLARLARPGQFVMVKPSNGLDPMLRRPFSIFEILRDAEGAPSGISILNKRVGVGTTLLYDARPGDHLNVLGPLGRSWLDVVPDPAANEEHWMVAGGVGLAPFVTLAEAFRAKGIRSRLFYGGRSANDLYYASWFESMGVTLHLTTEDGTSGERGRVTLPLERELAARRAAGAASGTPVTLYACGPTPMMRAVAASGEPHGARTIVSLEPVMGCGMGGCYSCVVRVTGDGHPQPHFVRSCLEGPVFDAARVQWDSLVGH
jgi:dihydroorotate dehydrogenase electron transfer subunit